MWTPTSAAWNLRGATFALWALAAASAVYWGLKLGGGGRSVALPEPTPRAVAAADPAAIAALLGSAASGSAEAVKPVPALATRFQLLGVAAGVNSGGGAAVISVDGRPARSFRVGANVDEGVVLHAVQGRRAVLADANGAELVTLEVPVARLSGVQSSVSAAPLPQQPLQQSPQQQPPQQQPPQPVPQQSSQPFPQPPSQPTPQRPERGSPYAPSAAPR